MASNTQHEVKAASSIIMEDVICQSFIQSSSTLAYACILIRRKKYDLATHVLHSLEAKQASRFKEMVFYLQVQIGIETGDFEMVKRRLVPRVNQHANDMVALSLLEACIYEEWVDWQGLQKSIPEVTPEISAPPKISEPSQAAIKPVSQPANNQAKQPNQTNQPNQPIIPSPVISISTDDSQEADFGIYQGLASDQNTQALAMGNMETGRFKSICRYQAMEPLIEVLPQILPGAFASACASLEGGEIQKICLSFQNLTVTSLHRAGETLELVTGNINQSLLTMVRAENLFQKQAASAMGRARLATQTAEGRSL